MAIFVKTSEIGGGTHWQSTIVTGSTLTAVAGKGYWIDTTSNACTITLPSSAAAGDTLEFSDYARKWNEYAVTLNPNGLKFQGDTANKIYNTNGQSIRIVYSGATKGWIPTTDEPVDFSVNVATVDVFNDNSTVALYQMNGNGNDSGGNYNLSGDTGSSNFATGKFGSAFNATGTNHLTSSASGLNVSGDFSVSFWYKSNNTGQNNKRVLTVKGQNRTAGFNNYNNSLGFYHGSGKTSVGTVGSVTRVAQIPDASVNDNNWHHIAFSITSAGNYTLYFDGSSYSGAVSGEGRSFNSGSYFAITTYEGGDNYNSICMIDQVRLFNRVITAGEVSSLYNTSG